MSGRVLVLNRGYEPVTVCSIKKALILLYLTKAELVARDTDTTVKATDFEVPCPSVIKLNRYIRIPYRELEPTRKNILKRDNNQCQYCGRKAGELTIDHVVPKSRGGRDSWENLVSACRKCNGRKADRTPEEAGMRLLTKPKRPEQLMMVHQIAGHIEDLWRPYLFL